MSVDSLPRWPGADGVYRQAQMMLKVMVRRGHVTVIRNRRGKPIQVVPSPDMRDLIAAMNAGNETRLKGLLAHGRGIGLL